jgi:hypothetical protein
MDDVFEFSDRVGRVSRVCLESVEQTLKLLDPRNTSAENVKSIYMLGATIKSLASSASDLERSTRERKQLLLAACESIKIEFRRLLGTHPELAKQVESIFDEAAELALIEEGSEPTEQPKLRKQRVTNKQIPK